MSDILYSENFGLYREYYSDYMETSIDECLSQYPARDLNKNGFYVGKIRSLVHNKIVEEDMEIRKMITDFNSFLSQARLRNRNLSKLFTPIVNTDGFLNTYSKQELLKCLPADIKEFFMQRGRKIPVDLGRNMFDLNSLNKKKSAYKLKPNAEIKQIKDDAMNIVKKLHSKIAATLDFKIEDEDNIHVSILESLPGEMMYMFY
jgi:hypothetical protein